jgi:acyl carrier protein
MNTPLAVEIRSFIVDNFLFGQDSALLTDDAPFLENGIIDSTGFLELVTFVERTYAITILDHELVPENMHSLRRICEFVARKRDVLGLSA